MAKTKITSEEYYSKHGYKNAIQLANTYLHNESKLEGPTLEEFLSNYFRVAPDPISARNICFEKFDLWTRTGYYPLAVQAFLALTPRITPSELLELNPYLYNSEEEALSEINRVYEEAKTLKEVFGYTKNGEFYKTREVSKFYKGFNFNPSVEIWDKFVSSFRGSISSAAELDALVEPIVRSSSIAHWEEANDELFNAIYAALYARTGINPVLYLEDSTIGVRFYRTALNAIKRVVPFKNSSDEALHTRQNALSTEPVKAQAPKEHVVTPKVKTSINKNAAKNAALFAAALAANK